MAESHVAPTPPAETKDVPRTTKEVDPPPRPNTERPPQTEELLCTICGMRSCWR
jgi:hypothetical protein